MGCDFNYLAILYGYEITPLPRRSVRMPPPKIAMLVSSSCDARDDGVLSANASSGFANREWIVSKWSDATPRKRTEFRFKPLWVRLFTRALSETLSPSFAPHAQFSIPIALVVFLILVVNKTNSLVLLEKRLESLFDTRYHQIVPITVDTAPFEAGTSHASHL